MKHDTAVYLSVFAQGLGILILIVGAIYLNPFYLVIGILINIGASNILYFLGHQQGWRMRKHDLEKEYNEK